MYRRALLDVKNVLHLLNRGTLKEISELPGVGKKTLQQVLDARAAKAEEKGGTCLMNLSDVLNIRGINSGKIGRITGNEEVVKLVQFCKYYSKMFGGIKVPSPSSSSVIAMDVGIYNIAMSHVSSEMKVLSWECLQFDLPKPYSPRSCFTEVSRLFNNLPSTADVFLIEEQSHRSHSRKGVGFMEIGLRLRLIEAMMYAVGKEQGLEVFCISPKMVSKYFEISNYGRYYYKKQAATLLSCHLVGAGGFEQVLTPLGNKLDVPKSLVEYYWRQKKMDDLSDCLLQAISFFEWREMSEIW